jgi:hypothetical protein
MLIYIFDWLMQYDHWWYDLKRVLGQIKVWFNVKREQKYSYWSAENEWNIIYKIYKSMSDFEYYYLLF